MFDLEQELKNLPEDPGVYIMHDKDDKIIYVGKAKILKNRVRQYFQKNSNHTPKVLAMVSNVAYFEYIVTDSETEALALKGRQALSVYKSHDKRTVSKGFESPQTFKGRCEILRTVCVGNNNKKYS